ncbi:MAG TPA: HAD family hydrolase [Vicinamibacterales bacterium]|nr:HAD family hydrolase [Vicinamibacterales bacterium]
MTTRAIFFDVDFTLIHPGPAFQGHGYRESCARFGIDVSADRFDDAVAEASALLDAEGRTYDPQIFIEYTARIIEGMGGSGPAVQNAAREIYDEWGKCHHFTLYEEVTDVLRALHADGYVIGLISNTQRSLVEFEQHFALEGLFAVALSSSDHGYMKPHPSIFEEALRQADVSAPEAVMVGDSVLHDIAGARRLGIRGVLVARSRLPVDCPPDIPIIRSLRELRALL